MKKEKFWITLAHGYQKLVFDFEEVTGYTEEFRDWDGHAIKIGVYRREKEWIPTEISTGCAIGTICGKTRKETFEKITDKTIGDIRASLKHSEMIRQAAAELKEFISAQEKQKSAMPGNPDTAQE